MKIILPAICLLIATYGTLHPILSAQELTTAAVTNCTGYGDNSTEGTLAAALAANADTVNFVCKGVLTVPEITPESNITINGQAGLVLSGGGNNRVLSVPAGLSVEINNIEIANGYSTDTNNDSEAAGRGGGIYNLGTLTLSGVTVRNNLANTAGGIDNHGVLNVTDVIIRDNIATFTGGLHNNNQVRGSDLTFRNNISSSAIIESYGMLDITRCEFTEHRENSSPAIVNHTNGTMIFNHCRLQNNNTSMIDNSGTLKITESFFTANGGNQSQIWNTGTLNIDSTTFSDNKDLNPTIHNGGLATLRNVTISGNLLTAIDNSATMLVHSSTITGRTINDILTKYLIYNTGEMRIGNTIISGGDEVAECGGNSPISSDGYNLHTDGSCNTLQTATDVSFGKPRLAPLSDNGGAGRTHRLLDGSDAIDKGNCDIGMVVTDQRTIARPQGSACDIGAFELEVSALAFCGPDATTADAESTNSTANAACLRYTGTLQYCSSPDADPDGDGRGREQNKPCVVNPELTFCSSKDADSNGDGWGWENDRACLVKVAPDISTQP